MIPVKLMIENWHTVPLRPILILCYQGPWKSSRTWLQLAGTAQRIIKSMSRLVPLPPPTFEIYLRNLLPFEPACYILLYRWQLGSLSHEYNSCIWVPILPHTPEIQNSLSYLYIYLLYQGSQPTQHTADPRLSHYIFLVSRVPTYPTHCRPSPLSLYISCFKGPILPHTLQTLTSLTIYLLF